METVVLLVAEYVNVREHVYLDYEPEHIDVSPERGSYREIKEWIRQEFDVHASSPYIAQVKRKHGIIELSNGKIIIKAWKVTEYHSVRRKKRRSLKKR